MVFNDNHFMLENETAKKLYEVARKQPIFDFHCHLDPQEIFEDKPYENIVDLWLGSDHYKWRLMRSNGISEKYITGNAPNKEKFKAWAETVSIAIGNPLYHWSHLEMRNVFGINEVITKHNWEQIYDEMNIFIKENQLSPRKLIKQSNVRFIGTTDHPLDDLIWHKKISEDSTFETVVAPTFRPDEVFVDHSNFVDFTKNLAKKTNKEINNFASFIEALEERVIFFAEMGAKASDLSLGKVIYIEADEEELDAIFQKVMNNEEVSKEEVAKWQTEMFIELAHLYKENNLVAQVHFGALRNNNTKYFEKLGPDTGFDSINDQTDLASNLNKILDHLVREDKLPKMVWYNLNQTYNKVLANTLANFQANEEGIQGKLQFGAGWWYNDTELGMIDQMNHYAEESILANFIGMLTDSRSFLSYERHDYFRRILCSYIGKWVEDEKIPDLEELLHPIIEGISYKNAKKFYGS